MGIMVSNDQNRNSELNQRISADLRQRVQTSQRTPDFVEDTNYIKNTEKTHHFGWVWIVLIILAIISLVCIIFI